MTGKPALPDRVPVRVNDVDIAHEAIASEVQNHPAARPVEAWTASSRALVVQELLLQEARRLEIVPEPVSDGEGRYETDDEAIVRQLIEQEIDTPQPNEDACRRYYAQNKRRFQSPTVYEVAHILFAASAENSEVYAKRRVEADQIASTLKKDPGLFASLARQYSDCPSAKEGGRLGQVTPGQTTLEFEAALATMKPGDISSTPVETRYGFHIVELARKVDGQTLPFEAVHKRIAEYLQDRVAHTAIAQYIARLVSSARIEGIDMPDAQELRVF